MITLVNIQTVFDKVCGDLGIPSHSTADARFKRWAMEAIEFIGGMHRIDGMAIVTRHGGNAFAPVVDGQVDLNDGVHRIDEIWYAPTETKKSSDLKKAIFADGEELDESKSDVFFDYLYLTEHRFVKKRIVLNRKDGYVKMIGIQLPYRYKEGGEMEDIYIPNLASYSEAIYWYIVMKLAWGELWSGKNKGTQHQYASAMWNNLKQAAFGELMMPKNEEEMRDLAAELGLGVSYTGLNRRLVSLGKKIPAGMEPVFQEFSSRAIGKVDDGLHRSELEIRIDELLDTMKGK